MNEITPKGPMTLPPAIRDARFAQYDAVADALSQIHLPKGTRSAYARAFKRFEAWCSSLGLQALPASQETIRRYVSAAMTEGIPSYAPDGTPRETGPIGYSTIRVHLAAIQIMHVQAELPNPITDLPEKFRRGLREQARPPEQKNFLTQAQLHEMVAGFSDTRLKGIRDRALLLAAFYSGGRRRSEIANMERQELRYADGDWIWTIPETKTRKGDEPLVVGIPFFEDAEEEICPARALSAWLDVSLAAGAGTEGPVFFYVDKYNRPHPGKSIQPHVVARIVKQAAERVGLDSEEYAGHSLRSGFATWATKQGVPMEEWMRMTDHRTYSSAARYQRIGLALGDENPVKKAFSRSSSRS